MLLGVWVNQSRHLGIYKQINTFWSIPRSQTVFYHFKIWYKQWKVRRRCPMKGPSVGLQSLRTFHCLPDFVLQKAKKVRLWVAPWACLEKQWVWTCLSRTVLNPDFGGWRAKSAESGNYEDFVIFLYCQQLHLFQPQIPTNSQGRVIIFTSF